MQLIIKLTQILFFISLLFFITACNKTNQSIDNKVNKSENMPIVNGKRTFIIGSCHLAKTNDPFKTLAQNGYNYVKVKADSLELEEAMNNNLNGWLYTTIFSKEDSKITEEKLIELVNKFKEHPALLYWEMSDEPAFAWNSKEAHVTPEQMQAAYNIIHKYDDKHNVITNHGPVNLISTLIKYNNSTNLVAVDFYPVIPQGIKPSYALFDDGLQGDLLNPYLSQEGEYIDKMKTVVDNSKPVFSVLQGFSWEMLKREEERDSSIMLYPTYDESRFMAYNAIVQGANGILIWGTNYTPQPSKFIDDLYSVIRELEMMQEILAIKSTMNTLDMEYHELGFPIDSGVEFITKKMNGSTYLRSVNSDKNPRKISFSGLNKFKIVEVLKEDRTLAISSGRLTDDFKPFDVHVYKLN